MARQVAQKIDRKIKYPQGFRLLEILVRQGIGQREHISHNEIKNRWKQIKKVFHSLSVLICDAFQSDGRRSEFLFLADISAHISFNLWCMVFNSLTFLIFLGIVLLLYYRLGQRGQNWMLIAASYLFYGWWD